MVLEKHCQRNVYLYFISKKLKKNCGPVVSMCIRTQRQYFFFFQSLIFFKSELSLIFIYFKNDYKIRNKTDFLFLKKQHMFTKIKFRGCHILIRKVLYGSTILNSKNVYTKLIRKNYDN